MANWIIFQGQIGIFGKKITFFQKKFIKTCFFDKTVYILYTDAQASRW
jgi:hypothetical protein